MNLLERRSALAGLAAHAHLKPGTMPSPHAAEKPAVSISERRPLSILQISAFAATIDAAAVRLGAHVGLPMPQPNRLAGDNDRNVRAIGPGIWQWVGAQGTIPDAATLRASLAGVATVVDLSHARTALRIQGPAAARTLAKHCGLDLDTRKFPEGSATNTRFVLLGATLARLAPVNGMPVFELLVFRGYAEFVFEALVESASEFGAAIG